MKTIISVLIAIFILEMLPLNLINANQYVRIVMEATDVNSSENVMKRSSEIMAGRLKDAGISIFEINIEPGRIILKLEEQYATDKIKNMLIARGRFEFRESGSQSVILEGKNIESMKSLLDQSGRPYAAIQFKKEAVSLWAEATRKNLNKSIAVVLDNQVIYDPLVREEISNGSCIITGNFTTEELQYFSILGNNGELPVAFRIVN
jgi:preprotein translocase subunit SecD